MAWLAILALASASLLAASVSSRAVQADANFDQILFDLVNQDRANASPPLPALRLYGPVASIAENAPYNGCPMAVQGRATDMGVRNYFDHPILGCNGKMVDSMLTAAGVPWQSWAENIGWASNYPDATAAAKSINDQMMAEPYPLPAGQHNHKTTILDGSLTHLGVGSWHTAPGQSWSDTTHGTGPFPNTYVAAEDFVKLPPGTADPNAAGPFPEAVSTSQYTLSGSDGAAWTTMDASRLVQTITPPAASTAILGANVDLFTNTTTYNQDVGIFVSTAGGTDQLLAWKESGGPATYSPNAAFVQTVFAMSANTNYTFKLKWKTNKAEPAGVIIYAGAGGGAPYSPTRLTAQVLPSGATAYDAVTTRQPMLTGSNGTNWTAMDPTNLVQSVNPTADSTAVLGANVDLFTSTAGYNQDVAIFAKDGTGPDQLLAWKESGGSAAYSPNAAFVQTVFAMTGGHNYTFSVKWKTNKSEPAGVTVYAGAGSGPYSPTRLTAAVQPSTPATAVGTQQYTLSGNGGSGWVTIDATTLSTVVTPASDSHALVGGNVDLFTSAAGYNQDVAIFVSDGANPDQMVAWKESGGTAAYSPNAAFVQAVFPMTANHTYTFKLKWKSNKAQAAGVTFYAGAGGGPYSPTRLTVQSG